MNKQTEFNLRRLEVYHRQPRIGDRVTILRGSIIKVNRNSNADYVGTLIFDRNSDDAEKMIFMLSDEYDPDRYINFRDCIIEKYGRLSDMYVFKQYGIAMNSAPAGGIVKITLT
jgi:hypothetical protein